MPLIDRISIHRGSILTAGYDKSRRILEVEFTNRHIVDYENVPSEIASRFLKSAAPQSYLLDVIEDEFPKHEVSQSLASKPTESKAQKSRDALKTLFG